MSGLLKKLTQEQIAEAVDLYKNGQSIQSIAKKFSVTRQAMWDHLRKRTEMRSNLRHGAENTFYRGGVTQDDVAQNLLEQAIEDGKVKRSDRCEKCGYSGTFRDGRTAIQAHHSDYNKPLDVMWLCQKCHHEWHKYNTAIKKVSK